MRRAVAILWALTLVACGGQAQQRARMPVEFADRIAALSEPPGYFDTDNLISNERSYQHALDMLDARNVMGGAYIGVGPDQNFSYIAAVRPTVAFIVDIRRDNLLLHLVFKGLFELAETRGHYMSLLFGREPPDSIAGWRGAPVETLLAALDAAVSTEDAERTSRARTDSAIATFGVSLSPEDWATIDRFHRAFIREGPDMRFRSFGREPRSYYPTYRDLVLERDLAGRRRSYLATEASYRFVRGLQVRDLVIPVVGDLAGPHAVRAIGSFVRQRGEIVSVYYTSNVEYYLFQNDSFEPFVANAAALPRDARSAVIRSVFRGPSNLLRPGYASAQLVQPLAALVDGYARGRFRSYWELVNASAPD